MSASILKPVSITTSMFASSSVAEPGTGEVAWNAATSYTSGTRVIRTTTHRVYRNLISGVNATIPELAPDRWFDEGPTLKWAWADTSTSTPTLSTSPYNHVVRPGAISDAAFFGLDNVQTVRVEMWDAPAGTLIYDQTFTTEYWGDGDPYIAYYFDLPQARNKLLIKGLPADSTCEIRTTLYSFTGDISVGMVAYGRLIDLGCGEFGFTAKPVDYSRIKIDEFGNNYIQAGKRARDISGVVHMPPELANSIVESIDRLLGTPVLFVADEKPAHDYLTGFGLLSADASNDGPNDARLNVNLRGLI